MTGMSAPSLILFSDRTSIRSSPVNAKILHVTSEGSLSDKPPSLSDQSGRYVQKTLQSLFEHRKDFIDTLAAAVNPKARVIIITDAGFQNAWFRHIKWLGWDLTGLIATTAKNAGTFID